MENIAQNQSVIIMTGMHRSGTSLTASLLQSAGVNLGDRLMAPTEANPKGYFEDWDFVEFHADVLKSQGIAGEGWTRENRLKVQQQYLAPAQNLIVARQNQPIWGWKDPRTTLFLDFWSGLIPQAKYIFVYRSPWEVVDSLFRRGDDIFRTNPNFAVDQWNIYNQAVLDFYQRHQEQCLLLSIDNIIRNPDVMIDLVKQKFSLELRSPESLYEPAIFNANSNTQYRQALITKFFPEAIDLYSQLQQSVDQADQIDQSSCVSVEPQSIDLTCESWILQDWQDFKRTLTEKYQVKAELTESQQQLQAKEVELAESQQQLQAKEVELAESQQQLQAKEVELAESQQLANQLNRYHKNLQIAQLETDKFKSLVVAMESSKFWQLRQQWFTLKRKFNLQSLDAIYQDYLVSTGNLASIKQSANNYAGQLAPNSKNIQWLKRNFPQKQLVKKIAKTLSLLPYQSVIDIKDAPKSIDAKYQKWLENNYPQQSELEKIKKSTLAMTYQPLISIIVPVYNPDESFLRQAIASVLGQAYPNWELCLADDCSTRPYVKAILEEYAQQDQRIKVTFCSENGHICRTSNSALEIATGEYIALLDHDDLLAPHALAKIVSLLNEHPEADFIYSDEDKVNEQNIHQDPFFKPDWCPDSFLSRMYTCHLGVYRRSLVKEIGNFRVGFEGSQDYDLVLRLSEKTNNIFHIPDVLYHWRIHQQSTASDSSTKSTKPYAADAAQKAIAQAIKRRGEVGKVTTNANFPGVYKVRYEIKEQKLVSIIIPTKDLADTLDVCLKSIFAQTNYPNYEVLVIDNGSTEAKTAECFAYWQAQQPQRFRSLAYNVPFNYSEINNYAVEQCEGDYLLFLNNDIEVITEGWLTAMVEQAQRPSIGAVGSLLLYPDDTIQHAGVVLGIGGIAGHSHKHFHVSQPGYISQTVSTNNYSAVTGACLMCRREVFEEVGGFETELAIAFNDVDLCLKMISQGYRNIYLPHVVLYHYESKSRGHENTPAKQARFAQEVNYMKDKWQDICLHDPCYNPHLTKEHEDYSLRV